MPSWDEHKGLTRRSVLGGAAAAGAVSLLRPAEGLAAAVAGRPRVFSSWIGSLSGSSEALRAAHSFALVGVQWAASTGSAHPRIELRTRARGGAWSRWVVASVTGHDPDQRSRRADRFGEPIWSGPADYVQVRTSRPVRGLRVHFVSSSLPGVASAASAFPLATPVLQAGPGQPPIIARRAWAQGHAPPAVAAHYGTIKLAFVHHSQSPNGYSADEVPAVLLSIFDYHRYTRQFNDIAYNFAIDAFGRIWEARAGGIDKPVIGAHAGDYNTLSTGVVVLGSFMDVPPSAAAIQALEHLLAWKLSLHGLPTSGRVTVVVNPADAFYTPFRPGAHVSLPRIAGHRDGDLTDCPGNAFYAQLPSIRPRVTSLAGQPLRVTLAVPRRPRIAGQPAQFSGRVATLSGAPLAGVPIELQQIARGRAITLARARSGTDGIWNATLSLSHKVILRALHRPAPASVSELVAVNVARR